jgi:hypothetical protein
MGRLLSSEARATFAVLDNAGHMLLVEQTQLFSALPNERLDRVEAFDGANHNCGVDYQKTMVIKTK